MIPKWSGRALAIGLLVVGIGLFAAPVLASVTIDSETTYNGVDSDTQTISTEVEITPDDAQIDDVEVDIDATDQSVVDFRTFSESIEPARSDVEVEYLGGGRYTINSINNDERFVITFEAYPKTIRQEELPIATVDIEYTQRGQRLSETQEITVDTSNSEYFALQESQEEVSDLEDDLRNRRWLTYGSLAVVLLVPLLLIFRWWESRGGISDGDGGSSGGNGGGSGGDGSRFS